MTWRTLLAFGLATSAVVVGCTVTTTNEIHNNDSDGGGTGGSAADSGSGGSSSGGASSGGASSGGASSGGASSGGASSGGSTADSGSGGSTADGGATCDPTQGNACQKCLAANCCVDWVDCGNDAQCGQTNSKDGELICIQNCLIAEVADGGVTPNVDGCAASCAEVGSVVSPATDALIQCIRGPKGDSGLSACSTDCFGVEL